MCQIKIIKKKYQQSESQCHMHKIENLIVLLKLHNYYDPKSIKYGIAWWFINTRVLLLNGFYQLVSESDPTLYSRCRMGDLMGLYSIEFQFKSYVYLLVQLDEWAYVISDTIIPKLILNQPSDFKQSNLSLREGIKDKDSYFKGQLWKHYQLPRTTY